MFLVFLLFSFIYIMFPFLFYFHFFFFFFFNDTATTEIYTLSLHDALPICRGCRLSPLCLLAATRRRRHRDHRSNGRSEEHTSELQSRPHLVCRLLLEKKKKKVKWQRLKRKKQKNI